MLPNLRLNSTIQIRTYAALQDRIQCVLIKAKCVTYVKLRITK